MLEIKKFIKTVFISFFTLDLTEMNNYNVVKDEGDIENYG